MSCLWNGKTDKVPKMEMPLKWITFSKIAWTGTRMCYWILYNFSRISIFGTLSVYPFPLSYSVTLGLFIHFIDTSSTSYRVYSRTMLTRIIGLIKWTRTRYLRLILLFSCLVEHVTGTLALLTFSKKKYIKKYYLIFELIFKLWKWARTETFRSGHMIDE